MKPFPWRPGMRAVCGTSATRVCADDEAAGTPVSALGDGARPDPTDPATIGALLAAVREVRGEPRGFVLPPGALSEGWVYVRNADTSPLRVRGDGYPTEFSALMAAWEMT